MIGNRVRVIRSNSHSSLEGILKRLDQSGAVVYRDKGIPEAHGDLFVPMHSIVEIVDLGRYA